LGRVADVTTLWTDVMVCDTPYDLTGNGINHPNDFGHRLYSQTILSLLAE
jgi:acyl-CoA thioesterase-1